MELFYDLLQGETKRLFAGDVYSLVLQGSKLHYAGYLHKKLYSTDWRTLSLPLPLRGFANELVPLGITEGGMLFPLGHYLCCKKEEVIALPSPMVEAVLEESISEYAFSAILSFSIRLETGAELRLSLPVYLANFSPWISSSLPTPLDRPALEYRVGYRCSLVIDRNEQLWVSGFNDCGKLGLGSTNCNTWVPWTPLFSLQSGKDLPLSASSCFQRLRSRIRALFASLQ